MMIEVHGGHAVLHAGHAGHLGHLMRARRRGRIEGRLAGHADDQVGRKVKSRDSVVTKHGSDELTIRSGSRGNDNGEDRESHNMDSTVTGRVQ